MPLAVAIAATVATGSSAGTVISYEKYMRLPHEQKDAMIRRYVKKKDGFLSVTQGVYTVHSAVSAGKALEYAVLMQDFASRLDKILGIRPKGSVKPVIYHFKDQKDMMDTIKKHTAAIELDGTIPDWAGGFYLTNFQRLYIFEHESTMEIMLHEGTHQYLNYLLGSAYRHLPMWVDDGLATNFETWDMLDSSDVNLKMNRQRSRRRFVVRNIFSKKKRPITLRQVLEKDGENWNSSKGEEMLCQYAIAWSFVDYLLSNPEGKAFLKQIFKRAYSGKKPAKIPEKILKHYEEEWEEYVKTKVLPGIPENADVEMR